MIYFDCDGVIRDTAAMVPGWHPQTWNQPCPDGSSFVAWIDAHLPALETAPPTEYVGACGSWPTILTVQPPAWRPYTERWLRAHLGDYRVFYFDSPADKLAFLGAQDWLVEDYPGFASYRQIILIDQPYNRHVAGVRVYGAAGLGRVMECLK